MQSLRINILLVWRRFVLLNLASSSSSSSTLFVFPLLFLFKCLLTAHVWLRKVQSLVYSEHFETIRGDIQYVKKKKNKKEAPYRLCFHSVLICLSSCLSWGLWQWKRTWPCGVLTLFFYFFFLAQQHLTISWNRHWLQCYYRDGVAPDVQYRKQTNKQTKKQYMQDRVMREGASASSLLLFADVNYRGRRF